MELRKVQENQERLATLLDNQTVETDVPALEQMMSIKDFDLQELLQSKEKRAEKVIFFSANFLSYIVVSLIGGKNARASVRLALDALLAKEVQLLFSKDGIKGKRAFAKTNL